MSGCPMIINIVDNVLNFHVACVLCFFLVCIFVHRWSYLQGLDKNISKNFLLFCINLALEVQGKK